MSDLKRLQREWAEAQKLDPEVAFYLRNQKQIEQWAALSEKASPHVDAFYAALRLRLEQDAPAEVFIEEQGVWSMVIWRQPGWPQTCGVGVCWKVGDLSSCFSGVRLEPGDEAIERVMALSEGSLSSEYWTVWRAEPPPEDLDFAAMAEAIRAELDRLWSVYAAVIRPELNPPQGR